MIKKCTDVLFVLSALILASCVPASTSTLVPASVPPAIATPTFQLYTPTGPPTSTTTQVTYYVAPAGNDANPGTIDEPWQTIQKAADTLTAGEVVFIRGGTYHEQVLPRNSGEAGDEIVYMAYPGEIVTIDGDGISLPDDLAGLFEVNDKSYIRISGLRVINAGPFANNAGILVAFSNHITIENNITLNTMSSGIGVWDSRQILIDGNTVEQAGLGGGQECITVAITSDFEVRNNTVIDCQKEGIDAKDGSSNGCLHRNIVDHSRAVGIYVDAWDKYTHDIEVFDNIVHDTENDGFALASEMGGLLENIRLYNNIAYNNRFLGINLSQNGDSDVHPMQNIFLINNTIVGNGVGDWGGGITIDSYEVSNVVVRNNIVSNNLSFQIVVGPGVPLAQVSVDHNLIDGFREYEGETYGDDYVEDDPMFLDPDSGDFHLQPGSPAVDAGSPSDLPSADFEGNARSQDGTSPPDIGAYEFGVSLSP